MATKKDIWGSPAKAAQTRIDMCKRYGLEVDPRDEEIVRENRQYKESE
jgi:hypothetical protein